MLSQSVSKYKLCSNNIENRIALIFLLLRLSYFNTPFLLLCLTNSCLFKETLFKFHLIQDARKLTCCILISCIYDSFIISSWSLLFLIVISPNTHLSFCWINWSFNDIFIKSTLELISPPNVFSLVDWTWGTGIW